MTLNELRGMVGRSMIVMMALGLCFCPMVTGHPEWALPLVGAAFLVSTVNCFVGLVKVFELSDN